MCRVEGCRRCKPWQEHYCDICKKSGVDHRALEHFRKNITRICGRCDRRTTHILHQNNGNEQPSLICLVCW